VVRGSRKTARARNRKRRTMGSQAPIVETGPDFGEAINDGRLTLVERGPSVPVGKGYRSLKSNRD
jgi:hypothetical protein